jgi:hypothetical protein
MKMKLLISLAFITAAFSLNGQFLKGLNLNRGEPWTWGGVIQLELLDTGLYLGWHSVQRFNPMNGDRTIANYYSFEGNDLGHTIFPNQSMALGGGLGFLPGFGFTRSNVFRYPNNDSLVMDFYDPQGNLQWSRSGMERSGISIIGVTNDSFAVGSSSSYWTPDPGIVKLDLRQGDISVLTFEAILDSLNNTYPGAQFWNLYFAEGGIMDTNGLTHFLLNTFDSLSYPERMIEITVDSDLKILFTDTTRIVNRSGRKINYFEFDHDYYYQINESYDSINEISNMTVGVFSKSKSPIHSFSFQQMNVPEPFLMWPILAYHNGYLGVATRGIIATPDEFDSTRLVYGYYSRFLMLDTNGNTMYDKTLRLDTNRYSRFVPEHLRMDDSLNLYFVASSHSSQNWYLGKITANGDIVNPLARPSEPLSNRFFVYPNPFSDVLRVDLLEKGNFTFKLYNLLGAKILERDFVDEMQQTISTDYLKPGLYIYIMEGQDGTFYRGEILKE